MWCIIDIDMGQTKQNWQRTDDKILLYIFVFFDKMSTNVTNIQLDPYMAYHRGHMRQFSEATSSLTVKMSSTKGFDENGYGWEKKIETKPSEQIG